MKKNLKQYYVFTSNPNSVLGTISAISFAAALKKAAKAYPGQEITVEPMFTDPV